jgi:hypothetical protein
MRLGISSVEKKKLKSAEIFLGYQSARTRNGIWGTSSKYG